METLISFFSRNGTRKKTYIKQTTAIHPEISIIQEDAIETMVAVSMSTPETTNKQKHDTKHVM